LDLEKKIEDYEQGYTEGPRRNAKKTRQVSTVAPNIVEFELGASWIMSLHKKSRTNHH